MDPSAGYPIIVMQDRYNGTYSGGRWLAIARARQLVDGVMTRAQFCLDGLDGPSDSDVEAATFWRSPPNWIAVGWTPDEAVEALRKSAPESEMRSVYTGQRVFKVIDT